MWTPEGIRPIVTVTGSHQRTCVFGTITIDGKQLFRQYDVFNQYVFLRYLKELQRKFRKLLLFIDRAVQHRSSIMVRKHLEENKDVIRVEYLPKGSSDYNAVEECWRQGKDKNDLPHFDSGQAPEQNVSTFLVCFVKYTMCPHSLSCASRISRGCGAPLVWNEVPKISLHFCFAAQFSSRCWFLMASSEIL